MTDRKAQVMEARKKVELIVADIDAFEENVPIKQKTIDWGRSKQQGKRSGGMVKGGMLTLGGKRIYTGISYAGYVEVGSRDHDDLKRADSSVIYLYVKARQFGCNHIEAMVYAHGKYSGKF